MSNTSNGPASKGSKFWVQTLVNSNQGARLTQEIQKADPTVGNITWLSPLAKDNYAELKLKNAPTMNLLGLKAHDLDFWPGRQPQWDAVGIVSNDQGSWDTLVLVEAKAHISEINTPCKATATSSLDLIETSLRDTHNDLALQGHTFNLDLWKGKYYQVGNRLAFLHKLRQKHYDVRLVFLNIVDDHTLLRTSLQEWTAHYNEVFTNMLGCAQSPEDVIVINMK